MTTRKTTSKLSLREYRSRLARLKRAGLVSKRIDARSHKPTRYMLSQLDRFSGVLDGSEKAVRVSDSRAASEFSGLYDVKFDRVIIKSQSGETARYNRESGELIINRKSNLPPGIKYQRQILKPRLPGLVPHLPRDTIKSKYYYAVPFRRGRNIERIYVDTLKDLTALMSTYEKGKKNFRQSGNKPYFEWRNYVEIFEGVRDDKARAAWRTYRTETREAVTRDKTYDASRKAKSQPRDAKGRFIKIKPKRKYKKTR